MRTWGRIYGSWSLLVRFSDPLPMGSGSGDQCPKNRVIFLFVLAQLTIGYGWASMAHIWNSADLRKPLSIAKPRIHSFSAVLELILGCHHVATMLPPCCHQFDCHCISVTDFFQAVNPYFIAMAIKLAAHWWQHGGNMMAT